MTNLPPKPPQVEVAQDGDLLVMQLRGEYTLEVAMYVQTLSEQVSDQYGYRLQLIDVREAGTITPDARRYLHEDHNKQGIIGAVAIVGANFAVRTLAQMVMRALRALTPMRIALNFCESEAEARAWLDNERLRLQSELHHRNRI